MMGSALIAGQCGLGQVDFADQLAQHAVVDVITLAQFVVRPALSAQRFQAGFAFQLTRRGELRRCGIEK